MQTRLFALLVGGLLLLALAAPSLGQSSDDLTRMQKEIEALRDGQEALRRDLQDIKALLRARVAPPHAEPTSAQPIVLNIDGAPFLGSKDAKITLLEFTDFQCPFCARHSKETLPAIVKEYVDAGKIKYVLLDFPIPALHPRAQKAHEAAHCAGEQGKYWEMHDRLFGNIRAQEAQELTGHAKALRLDARKFEQCLASERHAPRVRKAVEVGQRAGVRGTPTFFVGVDGEDGTVSSTRMLRGAQPYERFKGAIDAALSDVSKAR